MSEIERIEQEIIEIEDAIHKIHLNRLTNIDEYIKELLELAKGEKEVRKELQEEDLSATEIKRLTALAKTYLDEKNIIREIRYTIKLTDLEEQRLNTMKAKLTAQKMRR